MVSVLLKKYCYLHTIVISNFYENLKNRHQNKVSLLQIGIALSNTRQENMQTQVNNRHASMLVLCTVYTLHSTHPNSDMFSTL